MVECNVRNIASTLYTSGSSIRQRDPWVVGFMSDCPLIRNTLKLINKIYKNQTEIKWQEQKFDVYKFRITVKEDDISKYREVFFCNTILSRLLLLCSF